MGCTQGFFWLVTTLRTNHFLSEKCILKKSRSWRGSPWIFQLTEPCKCITINCLAHPRNTNSENRSPAVDKIIKIFCLWWANCSIQSIGMFLKTKKILQKLPKARLNFFLGKLRTKIFNLSGPMLYSVNYDKVACDKTLSVHKHIMGPFTYYVILF